MLGKLQFMHGTSIINIRTFDNDFLTWLETLLVKQTHLDATKCFAATARSAKTESMFLLWHDISGATNVKTMLRQ